MQADVAAAGTSACPFDRRRPPGQLGDLKASSSAAAPHLQSLTYLVPSASPTFTCWPSSRSSARPSRSPSCPSAVASSSADASDSNRTFHLAPRYQSPFCDPSVRAFRHLSNFSWFAWSSQRASWQVSCLVLTSSLACGPAQLACLDLTRPASIDCPCHPSSGRLFTSPGQFAPPVYLPLPCSLLERLP